MSLNYRPARLDNAPLDYEPGNEMGVVYLFSHLAKSRFGLRIETVRQRYPDCIAYQSDGRRVRIEFEYCFSNFLLHGHNARQCDWIVCWINDWPDAPAWLRIEELRKAYGLGFNVWLQPVGDRKISTTRIGWWSVPRRASAGDLVLYYRKTPDRFIKDIFCISQPVERTSAEWKRGKDWMGYIRRIASLKTPLYLTELKENPVLRTAGFVLSNLQNRYKISPFWPQLYRMILERNPSLKSILRPYGPERLA